MQKTKEVINKYFLDNQLRLTKGTIRHDRYIFKNFFSLCPKEYDQIRAADIRKWLEERENKGIKATTIIRNLVTLRAFYNYCLEEGLVEENPVLDVEPPRPEDSLPYYLEMSQLIQLRQLTKNCVKERAIIETFYTTGVRVGELVQIKKEDINWEERQIIIRNGKGAKDRIVPFTADCEIRLKHYLATQHNESPYLFLNSRGGPLRPHVLLRFFEHCSNQLGFKVTPHVLRHTFAAHLAQKEMPLYMIQDLLGHDNIENTRMYAKLFEHARKEQYDKYR